MASGDDKALTFGYGTRKGEVEGTPQLVAVTIAFVFAVSWVVWFAIEKTIGVRVSENTERLGQDAAELGMESYPEFVLMPEMDD